MDYELLEKAAMTKYEMSKKDPFRFTSANGFSDGEKDDFNSGKN